ncbi:MAG: metallophosphoesterase, partial [Paracoccaceae bacterium]
RDSMTDQQPYRVAVIADAHFHDLSADYGTDRNQTGGLVLRPLADVARSPRVFNEAGSALIHALEGVAARGIRDVVLLGDYSDDGQGVTLAGLGAALRDALSRLGLRLLAVPGNHDVFADTGRDRSKRFLNASGGYDLVTSNPMRRDDQAGRVILSPQMRCLGVVDGTKALPPMAMFGDPGGLHWETPFGPGLDGRSYGVTSADGATSRRLIDLSYLIEPAADVWLMLLDANVWVPFDLSDREGHDEEFADSTLAGWNAVLRHKPFLLDWMADVARRAKALGKTLLTFSHYPVLDPFADSRVAEQAVFGGKGMAPRLPKPATGKTVAETGVAFHISGHLHLNATMRSGGLVNVAAPSLVAFPAAFKVLTVNGGSLEVETVSLADMPMPALVRAAYLREADQTGRRVERLLQADTYGRFLAEHAGHLVARRYLRREWPADLAVLLSESTLADLAALAGGTLDDPAPATAFLEDWYRLRMGSEFGRDLMPPDRLEVYRNLSALHAATPTALSPVFAMFDSYLARLPSRDFRIDLATGAIEAPQG